MNSFTNFRTLLVLTAVCLATSSAWAGLGQYGLTIAKLAEASNATNIEDKTFALYGHTSGSRVCGVAFAFDAKGTIVSFQTPSILDESGYAIDAQELNFYLDETSGLPEGAIDSRITQAKERNGSLQLAIVAEEAETNNSNAGGFNVVQLVTRTLKISYDSSLKIKKVVVTKKDSHSETTKACTF